MGVLAGVVCVRRVGRVADVAVRVSRIGGDCDGLAAIDGAVCWLGGHLACPGCREHAGHGALLRKLNRDDLVAVHRHVAGLAASAAGAAPFQDHMAVVRLGRDRDRRTRRVERRIGLGIKAAVRPGLKRQEDGSDWLDEPDGIRALLFLVLEVGPRRPEDAVPLQPRGLAA